jgi:hypothetical protein
MEACRKLSRENDELVLAMVVRPPPQVSLLILSEPSSHQQVPPIRARQLQGILEAHERTAGRDQSSEVDPLEEQQAEPFSTG